MGTLEVISTASTIVLLMSSVVSIADLLRSLRIINECDYGKRITSLPPKTKKRRLKEMKQFLSIVLCRRYEILKRL
jgi:hypothetical protein